MGIYLYGSRTKGNYQLESDLDILLLFPVLNNSRSAYIAPRLAFTEKPFKLIVQNLVRTRFKEQILFYDLFCNFSDITDQLSVFAEVGDLQVERDTLVKLWETRRMLEVGMVDIAAKQMNDSFLRSLWWCIEEMKKNIDHQDAFISSGIRFHRLIAEIGQNEVLILVWDMLANLIRTSQNKIYRIPWSPKKALAAHKKIYRALEARNPKKAVEAMKQHMLVEEKALMASVEKGKA